MAANAGVNAKDVVRELGDTLTEAQAIITTAFGRSGANPSEKGRATGIAVGQIVDVRNKLPKATNLEEPATPVVPGQSAETILGHLSSGLDRFLLSINICIVLLRAKNVNMTTVNAALEFVRKLKPLYDALCASVTPRNTNNAKVNGVKGALDVLLAEQIPADLMTALEAVGEPKRTNDNEFNAYAVGVKAAARALTVAAVGPAANVVNADRVAAAPAANVVNADRVAAAGAATVSGAATGSNNKGSGAATAVAAAATTAAQAPKGQNYINDLINQIFSTSTTLPAQSKLKALQQFKETNNYTGLSGEHKQRVLNREEILKEAVAQYKHIGDLEKYGIGTYSLTEPNNRTKKITTDILDYNEYDYHISTIKPNATKIKVSQNNFHKSGGDASNVYALSDTSLNTEQKLYLFRKVKGTTTGGRRTKSKGKKGTKRHMPKSKTKASRKTTRRNRRS